MNIKRFLLSVFAVFIIYEVLSYVINSLLLSECYKELAPVWRKDMMHLMWLMYLVDLLFSFFFVLIYTRWSKKFNIGSGILFGLLAGLMMNTTSVINQWIIYPITNHLMVLWIVFGLFQFIICGMVMGKIYQPRIVK
jgi:beta-lactamase regulating signal transducer with metallopeptidase domain